MILSRVGRVSGTCLLALVVAALSIGVPVVGHTHGDEDVTQIRAPGHGHGLVLVQHEAELGRTPALVFAVPEMPPELSLPSAPRLRGDVPAREEDFCDCRAPPDARPRAPPL